MSKYTFTFKTAGDLVTESYWADDLMEATAQLYSVFPDAMITNSERQGA